MDQLRSTRDWFGRVAIAGQIEQGLEDLPGPPGAVCEARTLTDRCAAGQPPNSLDRWARLEFEAKTPEGYAYYGLHPMQYVQAARRWAHGRAGRVLVAGIRSIGTSLSAVVTHELRSLNLDVQRITVRPQGEVFNRRVELPPLAADWLVVVDEGPGLSGTSMASVARAAIDQGLRTDRIVFLPGNAVGQGAKAPEWSIRLWTAMPKVHVPFRELDMPFLAGSADLSAGEWRRHVYADVSDWPASCVPFESAKFLRDGVLWKHRGPRLLGRDPGPVTEGFHREPWIEGQRLTPESVSREDIDALKRYLDGAHGPRLGEETESSFARLVRMMRENISAEFRDSAERLIAKAIPRDLPIYTDGRMAPHEWIRTKGDLKKVDSWGHRMDHTVVGDQPVLWDYAGACVEWRLDPQDLLPECKDLEFYCIAYIAFRLGMTAMSGQLLTPRHPESPRLAAAYETYKRQLKDTLSREPCDGHGR